MILPFSTQIKGKPTYFVEKIHKCFSNVLQNNVDPNTHYPKDYCIEKRYGSTPKYHTIREDKNDRWQPGTMIDFYINSRTKDMFRFAPRIAVVSTQEIEINWYSEKRALEPSKLAHKHYNYVEVAVGSNVLDIKEIEKLAVNDGFENAEDFFAYFNKDFKGKIIHWTDLKY